MKKEQHLDREGLPIRIGDEVIHWHEGAVTICGYQDGMLVDHEGMLLSPGMCSRDPDIFEDC